MFHGYKTHTHTSLFTTSFHLSPCVCVFVRETQIFPLESQHSHSLLASLCAAILPYLSFPPIPNTGTLPAAQISPAPSCVHTPTPMNPCALWISLFFSLFLIKTQTSSASLFFPSFSVLGNALGH